MGRDARGQKGPFGGNASAAGDGHVPPGFEEKARLAVANCPEMAVEIVED